MKCVVCQRERLKHEPAWGRRYLHRPGHGIVLAGPVCPCCTAARRKATA